MCVRSFRRVDTGVDAKSYSGETVESLNRESDHPVNNIGAVDYLGLLLIWSPGPGAICYTRMQLSCT